MREGLHGLGVMEASIPFTTNIRARPGTGNVKGLRTGEIAWALRGNGGRNDCRIRRR